AAAPDAELILIRVDPAAPYQLLQIARYIQGEPPRSETLERRLQELADERDRLRRNAEELREERKAALDNFGQDEASRKRREAYFQRQAQYERDEDDHSGRVTRYLRLQRELLGLKGIRIVACPLVWNEGYPANGSGPLSRFFDDQPLRKLLWFQAGG